MSGPAGRSASMAVTTAEGSLDSEKAGQAGQAGQRTHLCCEVCQFTVDDKGLNWVSKGRNGREG